MAAVKILIVEDNLLLQEQLVSQLTELGLEVLGRLEKGEEVMDFLRKHKPDVILMDIHLAGEQDGIFTAEQISREYDIPVIYLTDYTDDDTFAKAKLTTPANFLPKPHNIGSLDRAIELAFYNASHDSSGKKNESSPLLFRDVFFVKDKYHWEKILINDIVYLEADRSYSYLFTDEKKYTFTESLNKLAPQISHENFLRVSRSHVVNVNRIHKLHGDSLYLMCGKNEVEIPVGKTYKELLERIPRIR